jgi:hypothetical protein
MQMKKGKWDLNNIWVLGGGRGGMKGKPNKTKPNQAKPNQTKPSQTKPNQTQAKPNQTKPKPSQENIQFLVFKLKF